MAQPRPEYAIVFALIAILVAIGIPAMQRGNLLLGCLTLSAAAAVAGRTALFIWRQRR